MNIWEILGIPPTEDIAKIKSAYAKQAKLNHPEEHPEEFKTLQNAYKIAMKLAKSRKAGISPTYQPSGQMTETPEDIPRAETAIPKEPENVPQREAEEPAFDFSGVDSYGEREFFQAVFTAGQESLSAKPVGNLGIFFASERVCRSVFPHRFSQGSGEYHLQFGWLAAENHFIFGTISVLVSHEGKSTGRRTVGDGLPRISFEKNTEISASGFLHRSLFYEGGKNFSETAS